MDTSETYIKMCEKAEEIQEQNPCNASDGNGKPLSFEKGNWYSHHGHVYVAKYDYLIAGSIWLPRQDQLQDMYGDYHKCLGALYWWTECHKMSGKYDYWGYDSDTFETMEQLWLAFVMKEKYNKVWNGDEWTI
jgi:hypothetical protein